MAAKTATATRPLTGDSAENLAMLILQKQGNPQGALSIASRAARMYPEWNWPKKDGSAGPTFAQVAAGIRAEMTASKTKDAGDESAQTPAPARKTVPAAKKAAPAAKKAVPAKKAAPAAKKAAPVAESAPTVETTTLRIVHDGVKQTTIFGVEKGTPAVKVIGKAGLGWSFWFQGKVFYLPGTQGFAPDTSTIDEAVRALESVTDDETGAPLYRVETEITTTGPDGKALPVRMSKKSAAEWQRGYTTQHNHLWAALGLSQGECACGVQGLDQNTGRVVKGADGMPSVQCGSCGGFAAPKSETVTVPVTLATLALPAAQESEECPSCKRTVGVVDGKFALHTGRTGNGACRGRRGVVVVDVEPEESEVPAKPVRTRRAARVTSPTVAELDVVVQPATGLVLRFALQKMSGTAAGNTATEVRQAVSRKIFYGTAFKGAKFEVRRDKKTGEITLTLTEGGEEYDAAALSAELVKVVKSVRGVVHQIHKAA